MSADLLQALEIVTELGGDTVGEDLAVLAIDNIALPVKEPRGDLVCGVSATEPLRLNWPGRTLEGVLDDGDDTLKLFGGEVTSALGEIDIGLLADQVGVSATDTSDLGQGVHDLLLSIDVCVQQTDDVLEAGKVSTAFITRVCLQSFIASVRRPPQSKAINYHDWPLQSVQHAGILSLQIVPHHLSHNACCVYSSILSLSLLSECC